MWLSEALAQDYESNERRASLVHKSRSSVLSRSERQQSVLLKYKIAVPNFATMIGQH